MRHLLALFCVGAAVMTGFISPARATVPTPSLYPIAWQLDFKHAGPKRIVVGQNAYWYMTYTVTNNTGQEQIFRPDFQMMTRDGKVLASDHGIPLEAFNKIKSVEGDKFLQSAANIGGTLHQGEDQAKDGVAIWKEVTPRMGTFRIFVGGLSGEFVILKDDDGKEMLGPDHLPIILRKTLELDYKINGDEFYPGRDELHSLGHKWIMR